jgi:PAS domain S-box-containing protein
MRMNLHRKSVLIITSVLFLAIGINSAVLTYISYDHYKQTVLSKATSVGDAMVREIGKVLALGLSIENIEGLSERLKSVTADTAIGYAMILDMKGKILFHSDEKDVGKIYKDPGTLEALASKKTLVREWGDFYDIALPLINAEGKHVGMLRIGVVSAVLKKELYNLLVWSGGLFVIGFFLFAAIIYFSVSRFITMPITKLGNAVAEIAKGDLDVKVEVTSKDEIGQLSESFNKMAMELKESRDNLLEYSSELETKVEKRTAELKHLAHQQKLILSSAGEGIFGLDVHGKHTIVNPAAAQMLGYTVDELIGRHSHIRWHSKKADGSPNPEEGCPICSTFKDGKAHHITDEVFLRKDGTSFPVEYTSVPITEDEKIIGTVVTFSDITERKRLEEQLIQAQKMESVGQLAGGIAHDFNNLLTGIIGYGNLLKIEVSQNNILNAYVTQILNSAKRAANLTRDLLAFSRRQMINLMPLNINNIMTSMKSFLAKIIGEDIELSIFPADQDLTVMADSNQIEHVLMNLVTNARDAMPDGGSLTIRIEYREVDNEFIKKHGYVSTGAYALISVEDTGQGMDEETKERLFEPFYTTKEVGKGTGLGLSMVYGMIKQHNGYIDVQSELGKGTTFNIYLPLTKPIVEEYKKPEDLPTVKGGTETILVAEDETYVRYFIKEVLTRYGYKVIEAIDGEDAIKLLHAYKDRIQLSLLDVIMPKKNGKMVYEEIKKVSPHMKVIFISGYATDILYKKGIIEKGINFISKPMSPDELLIKVRETLDS